MRSKTSSNPSSCSLFSGFASSPTSPTTATNGIVIATEKKAASPLIDDSMIEKVSLICPNIGMVYSGMGPDYRVLVAKARKSAQAYWKIYGEYPPTRVLVQEIATVMQEATQSGCVKW
jgi:20S proteasome subunit alpha 2